MQLQVAGEKSFDLMYQRERGLEPATYVAVHWHSSQDTPGGWAWTGFHDEELDQVLDAASATTDQAVRCDNFARAQMILMENALTLPTLAQPTFFLWRNEVQGFEIAASGIDFALWSVWLDR